MHIDKRNHNEIAYSNPHLPQIIPMNIKRAIRISKFIIPILFPFSLHAQTNQVTASAGGQFKGDTRQISFTIGEPIIQTLQNQDLILTQGFHQPQLWITEVNEMEGTTFQIKAFPNPTTDLVKLTVNKELPIGSSYRVYNINGALISKNQIKNLTTEIPFRQLAPASYFLKVVSEDKLLKTFKIIKK